MGLLDKAKAKAASSAPKTTTKQTMWLVGDTANDESKRVGAAVTALIALDREMDTLTAKANVHKAVVKRHADRSFVTDFAGAGVLPETPMVVQNDQGEKVTFVVQDRSSQYQVKADQIAALGDLLGADATTTLLYEETTFAFNRDIMAVPGVAEIVEKALETAVKKLTAEREGGKPILSEEHAALLLDAKTKTAFRPGTVERLPQICGRDTVKLTQMLEIMGSSCTRYVKV